MSRLSTIARVFYLCGLTPLFSKFYGGIGAIGMLHSVMDPTDPPLHQGIAASASFLRQYIGYLKKSGVDIVSPDEMVRRIMAPPTRRPFFCFTFDDGFRDNLTRALPVFEDEEVPFSVYPTVDFIERRLDYIWGALEEIFKRNDVVEFEYRGQHFTYTHTTYKQRKRHFEDFHLTVRGFQDEKPNRAGELADLFRRYPVDRKKLCSSHALSPDEVRHLAEHPLVTIGAHTLSHPSLRNLSDEALRCELVESKRYLETLTSTPILHLAYPFGMAKDAGPREFAYARTCGFESAVTARWGTVKHGHRLHPTALPRVFFRGDRESIPYIEFQRCGAFSQLKRKALLPRTDID